MRGFRTHQKSMRSFKKDRVKKTPVKQDRSSYHPPVNKMHPSRDFHFAVNAMGALSRSEKNGLLVITLLLVVGAGLAFAEVATSNQAGNITKSSSADNTALKPTYFPHVQAIKGIQGAFFAQRPSPLVGLFGNQTAQKQNLFYHNLIVRDISGDSSDCTKKTYGVSAGKVCMIKGVRHFLKVVETDGRKHDRKTNSLLGIHNLQFVQQNLEVTIPKVFMAYEKDGIYSSSSSKEMNVPAQFYVSSQEVSHFKTGSALMKKATREFLIQQRRALPVTQRFEDIRRAHIVETIGESGVAKLAVAGTFIQDLVNNDGNWGYNEHGLVIVDADNSPANLQEYMAEAARVPRNIELDFSINTIKMMRDIYNAMLSRPLPSIHKSINMSGQFYQTLVKIYSCVCEATIAQIAGRYPDLADGTPTPEVNAILAQSFVDAMIRTQESDLFSEYPRYQSPKP
jgi:hypothetical protein